MLDLSTRLVYNTNSNSEPLSLQAATLRDVQRFYGFFAGLPGTMLQSNIRIPSGVFICQES